MSGPTPLDHGMLNIPLAKRVGNIDAQIDRFKAKQASAERVAHRDTLRTVRTQQARVKELLSKIGDYRLMQLARPLGSRKPSTARTELYRAAKGNLPRWIAALEREAIPAGGCATCWAPAGQCDHSASEWLGS